MKTINRLDTHKFIHSFILNNCSSKIKRKGGNLPHRFNFFFMINSNQQKNKLKGSVKTPLPLSSRAVFFYGYYL